MLIIVLTLVVVLLMLIAIILNNIDSNLAGIKLYINNGYEVTDTNKNFVYKITKVR